MLIEIALNEQDFIVFLTFVIKYVDSVAILYYQIYK